MYKCQNSNCGKPHSSSKRTLCKQCYGKMSSQQNTVNPSNMNNNLGNNDLQNCSNLYENPSMLDTSNETDDHGIEEWIRNEDMANSNNYWENMNKLLDAKFNNFEKKFKDSILNEVKQITEPIVKDVTELKAANKELKTQVTTLKAKTKEQGEKLEKVEKVLREHHKTLVRSDKDARSKRLILAGVPENTTRINGVEVDNDNGKVKEVMKILDAENVKVMSNRRIGKKDQGAGNRPRYILIEFSCFKDRNYVKSNSVKLKEKEESKTFSS